MFWAFVFIGISVCVVPAILSYVDSRRKTRYTPGLFVNNFVDSKALFMTRFKEVASVGVVAQVDSTKVYAFVMDKLGQQIVDVHQFNVFDHNEGDCYFTVTILELANKRMIEIGNGYAEVMYTRHNYGWTMNLLRDLAACKIEAEQVEVKAPTVVGFARATEMN